MSERPVADTRSVLQRTRVRKTTRVRKHLLSVPDNSRRCSVSSVFCL